MRQERNDKVALILVFVNKSKTLPSVCDYDVQVLVGDGTPERSTTLLHRTVKDHLRSDGWEALVTKFMQELHKGDEECPA
jgi:hypothetical protein